jgi:hypothetical protein
VKFVSSRQFFWVKQKTFLLEIQKATANEVKHDHSQKEAQQQRFHSTFPFKNRNVRYAAASLA